MKMVKDVKIVVGEECAPQHKLVVCNLIMSVKDGKRLVPRCKIKFSTNARKNLEAKKKGVKVVGKDSFCNTFFGGQRSIILGEFKDDVTTLRTVDLLFLRTMETIEQYQRGVADRDP